MNRRIVTKSFLSSHETFDRENKTSDVSVAKVAVDMDTYFDKVIKYIPADIVVAWITVKGLISAASGVPQQNILWISFGVTTIFTIWWTLRMTKVEGHKPAITQAILSAGAFIIWVIATGLPFTINPLYGSLLLIFYTFVIALVSPKES